MASRTPTVEHASEDGAVHDYLLGWATMTELIGHGGSWSGNERNNVYLNLGGGRFADASFVSGLDFTDDGRAVAATDWDGDGDVDLWLRNRSGPQLRLMLHEGQVASHFIALRLEGTTGNRDAVGARVIVETGDRRILREVQSGDGYLAQSSRWLHFGLDDQVRADRIVVRWPGGGSDVFEDLAADRRYHIRQGTDAPRLVALRQAVLPTAVAPLAAETPVRVLLKEPLPLPPVIARLAPQGRPALLNVWASWCAPCRDELAAFVDHARTLAEAGIEIRPLSVDAVEDRDAARGLLAAITGERRPLQAAWLGDAERDTLDAILRHVLRRHDDLTLPTSLLLDERGRLQLIYLGPVSIDRLLADQAVFITTPPRPERRSLSHGRWYFRTPRDLATLAADLRGRGRVEAARYYDALVRLRQP